MMKFLKSGFSVFQKIGKSFMLPVSVLPVAGILLGVGSAHFGWMPESLSSIMAQAGGAIFGSLPLIFAISVTLGFTDNDGAAALASTVGLMVLIATLGGIAKILGHPTTEVMGIASIDTGVFGGIVMGCVAAALFKRYYRIQLPTYLGFFAGKRFVLIVTALAAIAVGGLMSLIWPPIQNWINVGSRYAAYRSPVFAATFYGFAERLLIPFGLHHIWNVPFFFEMGTFVDKTGKLLHGDINRFFAGDPTAGILGGAYLFKMWGLPAAALAIWHCARPDQKSKVGSIMVSAALTSFLTGITEPIEFSFIFVAPALYGVHAVMAGLCQLIFGLCGAKLGFTFSQGFIDFVLYFSLDTHPALVFVLGPIVGLLYYCAFRILILKFDFKTPGREKEESLDLSQRSTAVQGSRAWGILVALGGPTNLRSLDACITRLRVEVKDIGLVQADPLKSLGASAVLLIGNSVQAIFGPLSENIKSEIQECLRTGEDPGANRGVLQGQAKSLPSELPLNIASCIEALGGRENLLASKACAQTRVRVKVREMERVHQARLLTAGVQGVSIVGHQTLHLIVGPSAPEDALKIFN